MKKGYELNATCESAVDSKSHNLRPDMTKHATIRSQQRAVPPIAIDQLHRFGACQRDERGAEILFFDRRSRNRVLAYAGGLIGRLSEHLDAYAVVADGRLVTVGSRYKRIKHQ